MKDFDEHFSKSREERTTHIDLTTPCDIDTSTSKGNQMKKTRRALEKFLGIIKPNSHSIHTCHLCENNSYSGIVCKNPLHLYFGTAKENSNDILTEVRHANAVAGGKAAGKKSLESGHWDMVKHMPATDVQKEAARIAQNKRWENEPVQTCEHCGKSMQNRGMFKRWHGDNCRNR